MYPDLKGKTAIVTASSKGLGKAIALKLAADGASLAICSRSEENIASAAREIYESQYHPFNGWLDIAPIRGLVLAAPKGAVSPAIFTGYP